MKKLPTLMFILSTASLIVAVVLKLCGLNWFDSAPISRAAAQPYEYIVNSLVLMLQGYLIVGCVVCLDPKTLAKKYAPLIPLNILLYFIPDSYYLISCMIMLFSMSLAIDPRFSTVVRFVYGILIVSIIQQASIWLKFNMFGWIPGKADLMSILIGNIDQFILIGLFYYINVKSGEKYASVLALFRKSR